MTQVLAPGLMVGSAPPANGPPSWPPSSGSTGDTSGQPSPFEQLLTAVRAVLQGGEMATPPSGGTPASLEALPTPADLLAALQALAAGTTASDGTSDEATTELSLLDRLAGAGEIELDGSETEPGVAEALMALLVAGGVLIPADTPARALPSLDVDARDAIVAAELALRAAIQGNAATEGASTPSTGTPGEALPAPVVQAAMAQAQEEAGGTTDEVTAPAPTAPAADAAAAATTEAPAPSMARVAGATQPAVQAPEPASSAVSAGEAQAPGTELASESPSMSDLTRSEVAISDGASRDAASEVSRDASLDAPVNAGAVAVSAPTAPSAPVETVTAPVRTDAASLPDVVADVVQGAVLRGDSEVRLVLNPPDLGRLDIRIVTHEGGLRVAMEASQSAARDLIEQALPALQQGLEARDLRVDRLEVRATDTGRGSLDTGGTGQQSGGGPQDGRDGRPEWSAVASMGLGRAGDERPGTPSQQTADDGRLDVMA